MSHLVNWRKSLKEFGYLGGESGSEPFKLAPKKGTADYNKVKERYDEYQKEKDSKTTKTKTTKTKKNKD